MPQFKIKIDQLIADFLDRPDALLPALEKRLHAVPPRERLQALYDLGQHLRKLDHFQLALPIFQKALADSLALELAGVAAECHNCLGIVHRNLGQSEAARQHYEQALQLFEARSDIEGVAMCSNNLGVWHYSRSDYQRAIHYYQKSLTVDEQANKTDEAAVDRMNMAICYESLGDLDQALTLYQAALPVLEQAGRLKSKARCLISMAGVVFQRGDLPEAVSLQEAALEVAGQVASPLLIAKCHNNLGLYLSKMNQYRVATEHLELARQITQRIGHLPSLSTAVSLLAAIQIDVGNTAAALPNLEYNLELVRQMGDRQSEGITYGNIARLYAKEKNFREAIENFQRTLTVFREISYAHGQINVLTNLARVYYLTGKLEPAETCLHNARHINEKMIKSPLNECEINMHLANILMDTDREQEGLELYRNIHAWSLENDYRHLQQTVHLNYMVYHIRKGKLELAFREGQKAVELNEQFFLDLLEEDHLLGYAKSLSDYYLNLILIGLETGRYRETWNYLEKSKSRALLSILKGTAMHLEAEDPKLRRLLASEREVLEQLQQIQLRKLRPETRVSPPGTSDELLGKLTGIQSELAPLAPDYVALRQGRSLNYHQLQALLN